MSLLTPTTNTPSDPGRLQTVDPSIIVNDDAVARAQNSLEEAQKALGNLPTGDNAFFDRKTAEDRAFHAKAVHENTLAGHKRYEEARQHIEAVNQDILAADTNNNGRSDYAEAREAENMRLVTLGSSVFFGAAMMDGRLSSPALAFGALGGLGAMGMFHALTTKPENAEQNPSWQMGVGPSALFNGYGVSAAKRNGPEAPGMAAGEAPLGGNEKEAAKYQQTSFSPDDTDGRDPLKNAAETTLAETQKAREKEDPAESLAKEALTQRLVRRAHRRDFHHSHPSPKPSGGMGGMGGMA